MNTAVARPFDRPIFRYAWAIGVVAAAFLLRLMLTRLIHQELPPYFTFYPAVMIVAVLAGFWPGVLAVVLSALLVDYAMPRPVGYFAIPGVDRVAHTVFEGIGFLLCVVGERYRRRQRALINASEKLALIETQEQLHQSESKFQLLANSIPQMCSMAAPDGSIFWFNDRWYEYTGTTPHQMK